jgi:hypothetical protein
MIGHESDEESMSQRVDNPIERVLRTAIYLFAWVAWTTFGFIVWCAIITRALVAYTGGLFARIISGEDTHGLDASLDYPLHFWFTGFERLRQARHRPTDTATTLGPIDEKRFLYESLYTIAFLLVWAIISPLFRAIVTWFVVRHPWLALLAGLISIPAIGAITYVSIKTFFQSPPPLPKIK